MPFRVTRIITMGEVTYFDAPNRSDARVGGFSIIYAYVLLIGTAQTHSAKFEKPAFVYHT